MSNEARAVANPFAHEPSARSPQIVTAHNSSLHVRRTGLIPLCIGASRVMHSPDGRKRVHEARELRVEIARAQREQRKIKIACVCFECRKMYASLTELGADHPSHAQMVENDESHTWAYWSDDKYDAQTAESVDALNAEIRALQKAHTLALAAIAEQKDIESMMKERERAEKIELMIKAARDKLRTAEDTIIGLMSETPFAA